jgi:hypothetical protein
MNLRIVGGSKEQKARVRSLVKYSASKLMSTRLVNKLNITVRLKEALFSSESVYGDCIYLWDEHRPKDFVIRADADMTMKALLVTIAHEMVHVKQWARDEMKTVTHAGYSVVRYKKGYFTHGMDYWEQPWEIEAHGLERSLFERWAQETGIYDKPQDNMWAFDIANNYPAGYWDEDR